MWGLRSGSAQVLGILLGLGRRRRRSDQVGRWMEPSAPDVLVFLETSMLRAGCSTPSYAVTAKLHRVSRQPAAHPAR